MSAKAFLDTNVLIYALGNDPRSAIADALLQAGGAISVQVLNEFTSVALRKLGLSWPEVRAALADIRLLCDDPVPIDASVHERGIDLAEQHGLSVYDGLIVAAALSAGCEVLFSEDMHDGRRFGALEIRNPFGA
jgi:predicted nucleic acid-binding protein